MVAPVEQTDAPAAAVMANGTAQAGGGLRWETTMTAYKDGNYSGFSQTDGSLSPATFTYKDRDDPKTNTTYTVGWLEYTPGGAKTYFILNKRLPDPATGGQYTLVIPNDGPDQNVYGEYGLTYWKNDTSTGFGDRYWYRVCEASVCKTNGETFRNLHFKDDANYTVRLFYDAPKPAKPTGLSTAPGDTWAELTWDNPNNDEIKYWNYRQKTTGNWSGSTKMGGDPDKTSHRVWNLTNDVTYQFQIRAWTENKVGDWSDAASVTPKTAPDAPTRFRATPGNAQVALQWELPTDTTITQWQYRYKTSGEYGSWTTFSTEPSTRSRTVTGLTNGTEYTFQVRANTGTGSSRVLGDESDEWSATPQMASASLCSGTLTAGTGADKLYPDSPDSPDHPDKGHTGYKEGYTDNPGSYGSLDLSCRVFVYRDVVYTIGAIRHTGDSAKVQVRFENSDNRLPTDAEKGLELHVGNDTLDLSWDADKSEYTVAAATSPFTDGQSYTVSLKSTYDDGFDDDKTPVAPTGFTAKTGTSLGEVALAWDTWSDNTVTVTKWQYRQKEGTGTFGSWNDITGDNTTTSYTVTGLTALTTYTFQVRVVSTKEGVPSAARSATPPGFYAGKLTAGTSGTRSGWAKNLFGTLTPETLTIGTVSRTVSRLAHGGASSNYLLVKFTPEANERLPTTYETGLKLYIKSTTDGTTTEYSLTWNDANKRYHSPDVTTPFVSGTTYDVVLVTSGASGGGMGQAVPGSVNAEGGNGQVRVGWEMPDGGGAGGASGQSGATFEVGWTKKGADWSDGGSQQVSSLEATVTGLENGQPYAFRVRSQQGGETSAWSETVHATPMAAPGQPAKPTLTAGDGAVTASWTAPEDDGGSAITSYDLDAVVNGTDWNDEPLLTGLTTTSTEITNLTNGTQYAVRIRAVNAVGTGEWSQSANATPFAPALLIKGFPDVSLENGATHALDMAAHFSGDALSYGVMVTTTNQRTGEVRKGPLGTVARNKVTGVWSGEVLTLTAGAEGEHVLTLEMTATDANGGEASDDFQLTVVTAASAPGAPAKPTLTAGDGAVTASWTAPEDDGGSVITSYDLDAVVKDTDWNGQPLLTGLTATSTEITNLTNGTEYAVRIRAVNDVGAGEWSQSANATPQGLDQATLIQEFPDLSLANSATHDLDMTAHFSGEGLSYGVMVTTTHKGTGEVRKGPLGTVARNKVTGVWSGDVLTLTAGAEGEHVLTLEMTATDANGGEASDDFQLTVFVDAEGNPATLIEEFSDLSLENGATHDLDMATHFSGDGLSYGVMVTTTHKGTGEVRKGPLGTVARNKVTGVWTGNVLTLTAGANGEHVLTLEITATDQYGGEASDSFQLTVVVPTGGDSR